MKQRIQFTKMHGTGNDFVVIDGVQQQVHLTKALVQRLAHRQLGVGCDQVLLLEPPTQPNVDFSYRIFNPDGQEVEQCGNGARCIARFARDRGLSNADTLVMETLSGNLTMEIEDAQHVRVCMGAPDFTPRNIPIAAEPGDAYSYALPLTGAPTHGIALSIGNPHCILHVSSSQEAPLETWGEALQKSSLFPKSVNVSVVQILARNHIQMRIFERGVGETQACGSAACAAVIAGICRGELSGNVRADMPGGFLMIEWPDKSGPVFLSGTTVSVFEGYFVLNKV